MTFYLLVLPYLLVYRVFPRAKNDDITTYVILYIVGVIILQLLGSVRAYYSWKSKDNEIPKAPSMYYEEADSTKNCLSCMKLTADKPNSMIKKKTPIPNTPNKFDMYMPANMIELASLTLEFFQMASFALQNNPYVATNPVPTAMPTMAPSVSPTTSAGSSSSSEFWGTEIFNTLYIHFPMPSNTTTIIMWGAVALVMLLIVVFATQFLFELRLYGSLMKDIVNKDKAKDSFFYSFTGSIVYGHGSPNNISDNMRLIVATLSDALFLVISFQLLQVVACDYSDIDSIATMRVDPSVICWEGQHLPLGKYITNIVVVIVICCVNV